ncbi:hypothetical protein PILCRDRAFT_72515 [Piloderma croceum F 1598]|uniref:AAA+ ATPase domain-containing protein n=1 Tax=Piloderma croceum (strain F 1598) TaxID=765440 RepID=A0A0C3BTW0_PILCF|nr:hypothetical protein PILCRDRAFT_72515 [Piloderma croceum F 1598]
MRSQVIRRSRSLLKASSATSRHPLVLFERPPRLLRKDQVALRSTRTWKRLASSAKSPSATDGEASSADPPAAALPDPPSEDVEKPEPDKPKRRSKASKDLDPPQLPTGLDILWSSETDHPRTNSTHSLPPPEILEEALNNLHITLHPQTQHRACYPSASLAQLEPTLALYCPIEGGEYIIDETVRELARRTGSEVVVLDAVQLAAGEWGHFGKAASSIQISRNPLHFPLSVQPSRSVHHPAGIEDDDDDDEPQMPIAGQMTLHVLTPAGRARGYTSRGNSTQSKVKLFFNELISISGHSEPSAKSAPRKPRIIYVRDYPTLAPSSATWYPHLLSAVRERRIGPISRPSAPIINPMTIVFGITPSITPPASSFAAGPSGQGLINLLMSRNSSSSVGTSGSKPGKSDWGEDEAADKEREKRLRDRLRKWEKGDAALHDELPMLSATPEEGDSSARPKSGVVVIGGPGGMTGLPPFLESAFASRSSENRDGSDSETTRFFRTSILVPGMRSLIQERASRVARRREVNELTIRMGIGAVGGILDPKSLSEPTHRREADAEPTTRDSDEPKMWDDWGKRIELWTNVKQIADRAVGSMVAAKASPTTPDKSTLERTAIPWSAVYHAWSAQQSSRDLRKAWMKESLGKTVREQDEDEDEEGDSMEEDDDIVERIKHDPELDQHEQKLLPCIVDAASMPTSFSQVHLPPHTIDSVRTIVSLPLLHPAAFQQGILKEHGMTGCLLFGPPGTGKTLVVRALAKEAGCRMMAISPSDVMDMYVGEGEKLVKAVFSLARRLSPCVVFLDEIDALFGARMSARESGGAIAHRGVITEFMQEMDGLKSSKDDRVIVIGATNRPFDLDDAVLRRLPRRLLVDLPGEKEREEILKILLRDETLSPGLDLKALAKRTESFSGSDLKHLCVSAALDAVKERVVVPWNLGLNTDTSSNIGSVVSSDLPSSEPTSNHVASQDIPSPRSAPEADSDTSSPVDPKAESHARTLSLHHFNKALKEITPSSSEALGSLADLRKWNEEFGEGRKDKKRRQVWGKDRFGFTDQTGKIREEGRVVSIGAPSTESDTTGVGK